MHRSTEPSAASRARAPETRESRPALGRLRRLAAVLLPCAALLLPSWSRAQDGQTPARAARPQIAAVRLEGQAPAMDGALDDPAWALAPVISEFQQGRPREGEPATERTEIRFLYDSDALYIAARMFSTGGEKIQAPVSRRDNVTQAEYVAISLDPYLHLRTSYTFGVTAAGTRFDWYHPLDSQVRSLDRSFDPVWEAHTRIDSLGWTAEMRIPYSQLRFNARPVQVWGLNVRRWIPTREEEAYWVLVRRSQAGWSSHFGQLVGIEGIPPARRLELLPYVASAATRRAEPDPQNPLDERMGMTTRVGGDFKMGLGPNLTLDGTVNPDFGQVEADPADVNLSAYETFFPEKRPFFIEGSQLLRGDGPAYFYSRRVGGLPRSSVSASYSDLPETATILGAGKLTGRLASGLSVGGLAAVTGREYARTWTEEGNRFGRVRVAPITGTGVLRVQQDFGPSASTVGLSATGVHRDLDGDSPLARLMHRDAFAGGADWNLRFQGGTYQVGGHVGFSQVVGDSAALRFTQLSSARYFARPDAGHLDFDPTRTSLGGYSAALSAEKAGGRHWLGDVGVAARSPGFEINDAGSLDRADFVQSRANLRYRETRPGSVFRDYSVGVTAQDQRDFDWTELGTTLRSDVELTWKNFWFTQLSAWVELPGQSNTLTRGGPLMATAEARNVSATLSNRIGSSTRWLATAQYRSTELGGRQTYLFGSVSVRPAPRWRLSADPTFVRATDPRQYVTTLNGGSGETFGRRYVFASIDRTTIATQFRLDYTFTPNLTLEVYAEPFAATGRYSRFGELERPRTSDLRRYGTDGTTAETQPDGSLMVVDGDSRFTLSNRDFTVLSLRSNAVLRWEWRPGSTFFVAWQQDRYDAATRGDPATLGTFWDTFGAMGDQFLTVKLAYWLPIR